MNRDEAFELFEQGKTAADLMQLGAARASAYKWFKKWQGDRPPAAPQSAQPIGDDEDDDETAPGRILINDEKPRKPPAGGTAGGRGGRGRSSATNISPEVAGRILFGLSALYAIASKEPERVLTPAQEARLARPFAESCEHIPAPIAKVVNDYSAPAVFIMAAAEVVSEQNDAISRRKQADAIAAAEARARTFRPGGGGHVAGTAEAATNESVQAPVAGTAQPATAAAQNGTAPIAPTAQPPAGTRGIPEPDISGIFERSG